MIIYNELRFIMDRLRYFSKFKSIENQNAELTVSAMKRKLIQELWLKSNNIEIEETKIIKKKLFWIH